MTKTLNNTTTKGASTQVKDLKVWGDGDMFKLLCKASSQEEGWMKSTKAMETHDSIIIQVTTQQRNPDGSYSVAEALTNISGHNQMIQDILSDDGKVIARRITARYDYKATDASEPIKFPRQIRELDLK